MLLLIRIALHTLWCRVAYPRLEAQLDTDRMGFVRLGADEAASSFAHDVLLVGLTVNKALVTLVTIGRPYGFADS